MDKGKLFEKEFAVFPAQGSGYIVTVGLDSGAPPGGGRYAFTNYHDLLEWLIANAPVPEAGPAPPEWSHTAKILSPTARPPSHVAEQRALEKELNRVVDVEKEEWPA